MNQLKLFVIPLLLITLLGCSSVPQFGAAISDAVTGDSYEVSISIQASSDLNPTIEGRPSPLQVMVFQLTDDSSFNQATAEELILDSSAALGGALIASDETMVFPGVTREWRLSVDDNAKFIAIVGAFQREQGQAKGLIEIAGTWSRDLCISLTTSSIASAKRC